MVATQTNRYSTNISQISCQTGELGTDSHPWEQRQLGKSFSILRNNTLPRANLRDDCYGILDIHYGDVLIRYGAVINVSELQGPSIHIDDNCFLGDRLADGDIVMADTAEDTTAGKCVEIQSLMNHEVVAGLHTFPLRPIVPKSCGYWGQYLNSLRFRNQLFPLMQGTKVVSLSRAAVSSVAVRYPSQPEQRLIGRFFSTLDSLIAAAERQEALLRQKKQAYLQLMFPRENENEPRLRFTGFSGEWQQRQLGEVAEVVIGQSPEGRYSSDNQNGVALAQGNTDIADGVFVPRVWTSRPTKVVPADTLLVSVRAPVGDVAVTPVPACIGRGFAGIPGNSFLRYSLERLKTSGHWNRVSSGSVLDAITSKELLQTPISIATNQEEQCIGKFFTRLDHLIEIVGRHAETLRIMKRAYSQRMFI